MVEAEAQSRSVVSEQPKSKAGARTLPCERRLEHNAMGVPVYRIDPLRDPRWQQFTEAHPLASAFHSTAWLQALERTYGYEPAGLTTAAPAEPITNGLVFCQIASWLTGRRLVSLPFTDHCDILTAAPGEADRLLAALSETLDGQKARYAEIRPLHAVPAHAGFEPTQEFFLHKLDLRSSPQELFRSFHKDSVQRKIRRSEREGVTVEIGRSPALLREFYRLFLQTRQRHRLPPPPREWFRNLIAAFDDQLQIRVAAKDGRPIAGMVTLRFKDTLVYKYGGSDSRFHAVGGMQALFWNAIQEAHGQGLRFLDFGRSEPDDEGLITFKSRWGTSCSPLQYFRYPAGAPQQGGSGASARFAGKIFAHLPASLLSAAGKLLYKHVG